MPSHSALRNHADGEEESRSLRSAQAVPWRGAAAGDGLEHPRSQAAMTMPLLVGGAAGVASTMVMSMGKARGFGGLSPAHVCTRPPGIWVSRAASRLGAMLFRGPSSVVQPRSFRGWRWSTRSMFVRALEHAAPSSLVDLGRFGGWTKNHKERGAISGTRLKALIRDVECPWMGKVPGVKGVKKTL